MHDSAEVAVHVVLCECDVEDVGWVGGWVGGKGLLAGLRFGRDGAGGCWWAVAAARCLAWQCVCVCVCRGWCRVMCLVRRASLLDIVVCRSSPFVS